MNAAKVYSSAYPVLALDLGGTKILTALVGEAGQLLFSDYSLTEAEEGPDHVCGRILDSISRLLDKAGTSIEKIAGIGIAAAGDIDTNEGLVVLSPNLPGWHKVPLRHIIQDYTGKNTCLINDASAAALGEHRYGAGQGAGNMLYLTVSTGVGGGIIIDNRLYLGQCGSAGEIGHMVIDVNGPDCSCGNKGCLEALASGTAVVREVTFRLRRGDESVLNNGRPTGSITARDVGKAAQEGDWLASDVLRQAAVNLGIGLANLVNIFTPEVIVVGGGLSNLGELLLGPAREEMLRRAFPNCKTGVRVVKAALGANNGVIGAAVFAAEAGAAA